MTLRDQITVHSEVPDKAEYTLKENLEPGPLMCRKRWLLNGNKPLTPSLAAAMTQSMPPARRRREEAPRGATGPGARRM